MALTVAAERYPRYSLKAFPGAAQAGQSWNLKRVHRIYCLLKLNFRRKENSACQCAIRFRW